MYDSFFTYSLAILMWWKLYDSNDSIRKLMFMNDQLTVMSVKDFLLLLLPSRAAFAVSSV